MKPTDVIIDGASDYESKRPEARPRTLDKHVIIRADRADGFVAHNFTVRGALEHGIYVEEADGYRIDTVKMFWAADYGNLTFTSDHGLYTDCEGFGVRRRGALPGRRARDRRAGRPVLLSRRAADQHHGAALRHARKRPGLLGLDGQRRAAHQEQHLRQHRRDLDRHHLGGRPSRLPGRRRPGGSQLHLLEQPGPVRREPAGGSGGGDPPLRGGHLLGRPQLRPGARQLDLGQLARRRMAALDPGLPRHSRGQHQSGRRV